MQRLAAITFLTLVSAATLLSTGCSMCSGTDDFNYPTYGGIHQRADPAHGRVGSILSDPYAHVGGPAADSNLDPYPETRANNDFDDFGEDEEDDEDFDREDEDLDDDLEDLDRNDDLESIDPLDEEPELNGAGSGTTTASRTRWRRSR